MGNFNFNTSVCSETWRNPTIRTQKDTQRTIVSWPIPKQSVIVRRSYLKYIGIFQAVENILVYPLFLEYSRCRTTSGNICRCCTKSWNIPSGCNCKTSWNSPSCCTASSNIPSCCTTSWDIPSGCCTSNLKHLGISQVAVLIKYLGIFQVVVRHVGIFQVVIVHHLEHLGIFQVVLRHLGIFRMAVRHG